MLTTHIAGDFVSGRAREDLVDCDAYHRQFELADCNERYERANADQEGPEVPGLFWCRFCPLGKSLAPTG